MTTKRTTCPTGSTTAEPYGLIVTPEDGRLGLLRPAHAGARRRVRLRHRRGGDDRPAAERGLRGRVRRRDVRADRPQGRLLRASPTSRTCPRDATVRVRGSGRFALPSARCANRMTPRYGPAEDVPVELRGAGVASRQVNNFCTPEAFPHADKLIACEVLTPGGNWSSYPPHKHDEDGPASAVLEEIYYFEVAGERHGLPAGVRHRGPADRRAGRGAYGRRGDDPARLARPVDGRPGLRPVLPERHGRSRRRSGSG